MTLFLDIDGTLSTTEQMLKAYGKRGYRGFCDAYKEILTHLDSHIIMLDRSILNGVVLQLEKFDNIIIHSAWNKSFSLEELQLAFYIKGYPEIADKITGILKINDYSEKITTIETYCEENNITDFFTMDDELTDYPKNIMPTYFTIKKRLEEIYDDKYINELFRQTHQ